MTHLDLDLLLPEKATVGINGKVYEVKPVTVKHVIQLSKLADNKDPSTQLEAMRSVISEVIPDLKEDIFDLPMAQVQALFSFCTSLVEGGEQKKTQQNSQT